ncbi:MAG: tetratricopeptide repeat protein [Bacteroidales bacterium]|nr:tetratricopeptide repeat protein [Bacteroidales bacterium]
MRKFFSLILIIILGYFTSYIFVGKSKGYELVPKDINIEDISKNIEKYFENLGKTKVSEQDSLYAIENFDAAMEFYNTGDYEQATWNFEYAFEINPYFYEAEYYLAKSYLKNEQFYDAYYEFDQLLYNSPDYDSAYLYLAQTNFYINDFYAAANSIDTYLQIFPNSKQGLFWRANINYYSGYPKLAISYLQELIKLYPDYAPAYSLLSVFYINEQESQNAISTLRIAYQMSPQNFDIVYNLASIYFTTNNIDSALFLVEEANNINSKDDRLYNLLALVYLEKEKYTEALEAINKAIDFEYLYSYIATRAKIYFNQGDYKNAKTDFMDCYEGTYDVKYLISIAETFEKIGDNKEAIEYYSSYLDLVSYDDTNRTYVVERIQSIEDAE